LPSRENSKSITHSCPSHLEWKLSAMALARSHAKGNVLEHHKPRRPLLASHHVTATPYESPDGRCSCTSSKNVNPPGPERYTSSPDPRALRRVEASGSYRLSIAHRPLKRGRKTPQLRRRMVRRLGCTNLSAGSHQANQRSASRTHNSPGSWIIGDA
jgi:hypothetical protein